MTVMNIIIGTGIVGIIIYLILKLIHSGLHEFKQIFFLNSKNILVAVILADLYVILDVLVIKSIASVDIWISVIVMVITTTISISTAMIYQQKNLKEHIYTFEITTKYSDIRFQLKDVFQFYNIPYEYSFYYFQNDKNEEEEKAQGIEYNRFGEALYHKYLIHAFNRRHSKRLEDIVSQYDKSKVKWLKTDTGNYKD